MQYQYTDNGREILEWIPAGLNGGQTLADCLAEAKAKGLTWDEEKLPEVEPIQCIALGEAHVANSGFTASRLVTLMDSLMQAKEANALAAHPKLVALYTWLQTVKGMAVAGQVNFPPAPYTFEEVISE